MDIQRLADRQLRDYDNHSPGSAFAQPDVRLTTSQAYQLQFAVAERRQARGEKLAGYKIGCVSRTMQKQLGLTHPVFGHVWASELHRSGATLDPAQFDHLAVEGEFAVRLAADIPSRTWLEQNPDVFESLCVVIELHHYVFRAPSECRAGELIGNNAIHAGVVLPDREVAISRLAQLANADLCVWRNGTVIGETAGAANPSALVDPIGSLIEHLAANGQTLRAGQLVLTGSPLPLWPIEATDKVVVESSSLAARAKLCVSASSGPVTESQS